MAQQRQSVEVIETSTVFSDRTKEWIEQAASNIAVNEDDDYRRFYEAQSNGESQDSGSSSSSSGEEEVNNARDQGNRNDVEEATATEKASPSSGMPKTEGQPPVAPTTLQKKNRKSGKDQILQQRAESQIQRAFDSIPHVQLLIPNADNVVLELASCFLSKNKKAQHPAHAFLGLFQRLCSSSTIVILTVRSGRFAGAVYDPQKTTCLAHTTSSRYTVRRGQGKAQTSQDAGNRRPLSMGAQLRRHGEIQLQNDITKTLADWETYIDNALVILVSIPKTMIRTVLGERLSNDERLCRVPLDTGRPSFESVEWIHTVLTRSVLRKVEPEQRTAVDLTETKEKSPTKTETVEAQEPDTSEPSYPELTPLHQAAESGDADSAEAIWLESASSPIDPNGLAGPDFMTPLHYAAQASSPTLIQFLLETARADPAILDLRDRAPYYLAETAAVRDAFRRSRATLGEDYCDWNLAKVGPALTDKAAQQKQERLAEKRRAKRKKQKERKAMEQAAERTAQLAAQQALEAAKQQEEAKRVRDGLAEKMVGACDFCQTVCKGRQRANMLQRLGYKYCTTECVQKHKRELMASAAAARFGG